MKRLFLRLKCLLGSRQNKGRVVFLVTGEPSNFNITYKCSRGKTCQEPAAKKGWSTSFRASKGDYVYCSAQANKKAADFKVEIFFRGNLFKTAYGKGDYAIATSSGILQ